jgi:hypothetical protein
MDNSQVVGTVALIISVVGAVLAAIKGKYIRSRCCGRKLDVGVDVISASELTPNLAIQPQVQAAEPKPSPAIHIRCPDTSPEKSTDLA